MARRDVVVVGASAGGVEALRALVANLPADLPATVLVVLHTPAAARSALAAILDRSGPLPASAAVEDDPLTPGRVLVAPPDRHLIVADGYVTLSRGPRENGHRPAVDVLFRSAARALGPRVVAVVLSGTLDDGTAGMVAVHARGGITLVQDPDEATFEGMPVSAIEGDSPAAVLPVRDIAARLVELVGETVPDEPASQASDLMHQEVGMAELEAIVTSSADPPGKASGYACPDCTGVLWELTEGGLTRYRCRVGHAWSPQSLAAQQAVAVEGALWMALRALEEKASLATRMAEGAVDRGHRISSLTFEEHAAEAAAAARILRDLIERVGTLVPHVESDADLRREPSQPLP
ncbi:chemotaxis protein CheB [Actinotalea ferrariae]|uniref:chemotaxis protein CheB n=1 Tax=Actinotalea ferrariae TaxID=1386098 RepID=UPI001C8B998A|nr:chemotaxis protein CheB [Actinotalea ferrariae]MBX9243878.1 chemotaxis protein CheB [Actinotalea ferrariae]